MDFRALVKFLNETAAWYATLPARVREEKRADAEWVVRLFQENLAVLRQQLFEGNLHGLPGRLQGMKGIFTRPNKGSILNLNAQPELNAHAEEIYVEFETWWRAVKDFNGANQQQEVNEETRAAMAAAAELLPA